MQVALRDGVLVAASGNGQLFVLDPHSGVVSRQLDLHVTSPFDLAQCQEGIVLVNGGVGLVPAIEGARLRSLGQTSQTSRFIAVVQRDSTLFAYGPESIMALRCH